MGVDVIDKERSEATKRGLAKAVANGQKLGRPRKVEACADQAQALWRGGKKIREIATELGVSRSTVQRALKYKFRKTHKRFEG